MRTTLLAATASGVSPCTSTATGRDGSLLSALTASLSADESLVLFLMLPSILLLSPFMDFIVTRCGGRMGSRGDGGVVWVIGPGERGEVGIAMRKDVERVW